MGSFERKFRASGDDAQWGRGERRERKNGNRAPKPHAARREYLSGVDVARKAFPFLRSRLVGIVKAWAPLSFKTPVTAILHNDGEGR
ncbi:hypothetical protein EDM56_20245 [Brevibacillus fluminis]|uniref:Uncharacterized protein n=1 Tax=Brevibacillus fluminis TaxID=511487 RepID=A0A3M8D915_9BACL|nr:hypothetical protein EDM56_20245 [Brevibacillus fluminis]